MVQLMKCLRENIRLIARPRALCMSNVFRILLYAGADLERNFRGGDKFLGK